MKLLGSTKSKIIKDKKDEYVPHLEIIEVTLVHFDIVNTNYQHNSKVLYALFIHNKPFFKLLDI